MHQVLKPRKGGDARKGKGKQGPDPAVGAVERASRGDVGGGGTPGLRKVRC